MAIGLKQQLKLSQQLVMTPQLQQAIKLLAASNLEIETFIGEALESNPLLEAGAVSREDTGPTSEPEDIPREEFTADQLMGQAQGESEAPLDIDTSALDRDRDTGEANHAVNAEWGAAGGGGLGGEEMPDFEATKAAELSLTEHLEALVKTAELLHPDADLREGLRRVGQTAYPTFVQTMLGRVLFGVLGSDALLPAALEGLFAKVLQPFERRLTGQGVDPPGGERFTKPAVHRLT